MATAEEIKAEVEELGRLSERAEDVMYNIVLRQEELGREPSNIMLSKLKEDPIYEELLSREYLTYELFNHGNPDHAVACLYVTLKGTRYCIIYGDEINERRRFNAAGVLKEKLK